MESKDEQYKLLVKALLPEEIFKYFEIVQVIVNPTTIDVHLDELNLPSPEFKDTKLISKGFYPSVVVQDFPLRERAMFLHVRRRKWQVESTGDIVSNKWGYSSKRDALHQRFRGFFKRYIWTITP